MGADSPITAQKEARRLRAFELKEEGWDQRDIAEALGVTEGAVSQWMKMARELGPGALIARPHSGAPGPAQRRAVATVAGHIGPRCGSLRFSGRGVDVRPCGSHHRPGIWSALSPGACLALAHEPGLDAPETPPAGKPTQRRGDWALAHRKMATLKKGALSKGQMPVFIDESGFYLLPAKVRTYAPCGLRPELRVCHTHAHLGVMSGLTPAGDLFSLTRARSLRSLDTIAFVAHLLGRLRCRLLLIWDRINIHRSQEVQAFLASLPTGAVQVEELPACAPELNPQEGIWHLLKDVELKNVCCRDLPQLKHEVCLAIRRLRSHPNLILSCFEGAGLRL